MRALTLSPFVVLIMCPLDSFQLSVKLIQVKWFFCFRTFDCGNWCYNFDSALYEFDSALVIGLNLEFRESSVVDDLSTH